MSVASRTRASLNGTKPPPPSSGARCVECDKPTDWKVIKSARYVHACFVRPYCLGCWPPSMPTGVQYNGDAVYHQHWTRTRGWHEANLKEIRATRATEENAEQ